MTNKVQSMDKNKILALGAIFAVVIMFGSAVLIGLVGNEPKNNESESKEMDVKLSSFENNSINVSINNIKEGLGYLPEGTIIAQFNKMVPRGAELYNNTTNITSIFSGKVYYRYTDENKEEKVTLDPFEYHKLENYENATTLVQIPSQGKFPVYNGYICLPKGNKTLQVPGSTTLIGTEYTIVGSLNLIAGKTKPTSAFDTIASYIDESEKPDIEHLALGMNDSYKTYYESVHSDSENRYVRTWIFEEASDELKERIRKAVDKKEETQTPVEKIFKNVDDKIIKIEIKSKNYKDMDSVSLNIAHAIAGTKPTETPSETSTEG